MLKKILMLALLAAPLSLAAQKFAYFDYTNIMQALPDTKKATSELETMAKQFQDELQNMEKEISTKYEKYKTEVTDKTPENIRTRREQELTDLQQRYQQAASDNQKAFDEARSKKMQPIIQKVMDAVNAVAKEQNFIYVIDKTASQSSGIVINEALCTDATQAIATKLGLTAAALKAAATAATTSTTTQK